MTFSLNLSCSSSTRTESGERDTVREWQSVSSHSHGSLWISDLITDRSCKTREHAVSPLLDIYSQRRVMTTHLGEKRGQVSWPSVPSCSFVRRACRISFRIYLFSVAVHIDQLLAELKGKLWSFLRPSDTSCTLDPAPSIPLDSATTLLYLSQPAPTSQYAVQDPQSVVHDPDYQPKLSIH